MDQKTADLFAQLLPLLLAQLATKQEAAPAAPAAPGNVFGSPQIYNGPTVAVTPTGLRATGETRYWPVPLPGENFFTYLGRMCSTLRPDGLPYVPAQYRAQISTLLLSPGNPTKQVDFPTHADAFAYPEEWRTAEQWAQHDRDVAGWAAWNRAKQGGSDAGAGGSV